MFSVPRRSLCISLTSSVCLLLSLLQWLEVLDMLERPYLSLHCCLWPVFTAQPSIDQYQSTEKQDCSGFHYTDPQRQLLY